jgi:DNA polymerase-1
MVVPAAGHLLLAVDYSYIELRTLAAVCLDRFGYSQLAQVIQEGIDPHCYTASQFAGLSLEEFFELPTQQQKDLRQKAKALNFGIPGLLGARSLVAYAKQSYGVTISEDEAEEFRRQHINEVYPELGDYLEEDLAANVAENLRTTPQRVLAAFTDEIALLAARKIVRGETKNAQGKNYRTRYVDAVWMKLAVLNKNAALAQRLQRRQTGDSLVKRIFWGTTVTLTGRIRGRVSFSRQCNTPFQGLAADGAKLGLWRLYREGFRIVAFIHDEVLVELPENANHTALAQRVEKILCDSMSEVVGTVPIACEYALSRRWYKQAEAVFNENGQLLIWEPNHAQ